MTRLVQLLYFAAFHYLAKFLLRARVDVRVDAADLDVPVVIASNHEHRFDPFLLVLLPWKIVRRIIPLAFPTGRYFDRQPWLWPLLALFGAYRLPRYAWSLEEYLETTAEKLRSGRTVMIFPEGGIGRTGKARPGVGLLATTENCIVLPMCIDGSEGLSLASIAKRASRVVVRLGKPLRFDVSTSADEAAATILTSLYDLRPLSDPSRRG